LKAGDTVILKTVNSVYLIKVMEEEQYTVSGGWFDKNNSYLFEDKMLIGKDEIIALFQVYETQKYNGRST
jgi:hypothetical protein